jgi:release factor glutamine methyltransferase
MKAAQALEHARQVLEEGRNLPREQAHARARLLLDHVLQSRFAHLLSPAQELSQEQQEHLQSVLERASRGEPLPYITGRQEFYGREFAVGPGVLIPRPETELLAEAALHRLAHDSSPRVADLGCGSGCIAISLALEKPGAQVLATDISPQALAIAQRNATKLSASMVEFALSDAGWLRPLEDWRAHHGLFDAIVSNPPYIPRAEIESLQTEVRDFEPCGALDGGPDGLEPYRLFARELRPFLQPQGFVALELGAGQFGAVRQEFQARGWRVEDALLDLSGIERVLIAWA